MPRPSIAFFLGAADKVYAGCLYVSTACHHQPLPLPLEYANQVMQTRTAVNKIREEIAGAELDDDQRQELHQGIQAHFKEWLLTTGNARQVTDLVRLFKEGGYMAGGTGSGPDGARSMQHRRSSDDSADSQDSPSSPAFAL